VWINDVKAVMSTSGAGGSEAPTSLRVSVTDLVFAGSCVAYLVGPLEKLDDPDRLRRRLKAIAQGGPRNRIGLMPDSSHRRWRFDSTCSSVVVCEGPDLDCDDPARALESLMVAGPQVPDISLRVHVADPWLFIMFDHGLGGGRLFTEVMAAVGASEPGFADPAPRVDCRNPGLRAAINVARTAPWQLLKTFNEPVGRSSQRSSGNMGPFAGKVSVAYARSGAEYLTRAREIRDRYWPEVSISALITSSFLRSLQCQGITPEEEVTLIVDLNRYLPSDVGTLSNFLSTVPVITGPPYSPDEIAASVRDYTTGFRTLTRYGMRYAARLVSRPGPNTVRDSGSSLARILVSDHSNMPGAGRIAWSTSTSPHVFVRRCPLGLANQISLAINRVQSELHLTASYYDSVFDRAKLQASLDSIVAAEYLLPAK
jgi:hypothetical protein